MKSRTNGIQSRVQRVEVTGKRFAWNQGSVLRFGPGASLLLREGQLMAWSHGGAANGLSGRWMRQDAERRGCSGGSELEGGAGKGRRCQNGVRENSLLRGCSQGGDVQMSVIVLWIKYTDNKQLSGVLALFSEAVEKRSCKNSPETEHRVYIKESMNKYKTQRQILV